MMLSFFLIQQSLGIFYFIFHSSYNLCSFKTGLHTTNELSLIPSPHFFITHNFTFSCDMTSVGYPFACAILATKENKLPVMCRILAMKFIL